MFDFKKANIEITKKKTSVHQLLAYEKELNLSKYRKRSEKLFIFLTDKEFLLFLKPDTEMD